MVTIGIDAHKRSHTAVAVDEQGRQLDQRRTGTTSKEHLELVAWAAAFGNRRWAVEDCRHLSRRLERDLLAAGERIVRVPPKLMANARTAARSYGKSDPIDALAVARAALREPDLPVSRLDGPEREVRLLVDHREDLVGERTRMISRLRWHLHELDPGSEPAPRTLNHLRNLDRVADQLAGLEGTVARIATSARRSLPNADGRDQPARAGDQRARRETRPDPARGLRLRRAHGREDPRRDRRRRTLQEPRRVRPRRCQSGLRTEPATDSAAAATDN